MERNFSDFILEVKRANDIVDVVGGYLELRQSGQNWWARCPFHGEKTPSFSVNRSKQIYKCFGCGETGDVLSFVQKYESCDFVEALQILATRAGLKMPEMKADAKDRELAQKKNQKDILMNIVTDTARIYFKTLRAPQGKHALDYLQKRGISKEVSNKFGLGLSEDMFTLPNLLKQKYSEQDCIKAGVLSVSQKGHVFDALAQRLIIPIFNIQGQVIAFGGRALTKERESFGKYKNTIETPIFSKSNVLFGANVVKTEKQQGRLKHLILVEGYMDVISLYQAGITTAVASMGTSLTQKQAWQLAKLANEVYICYDGDSAGQDATLRGLDVLKNEGLEVFVMSIPNGKDPDEFVKEHGVVEFEKLVEQAKPLTEYKLDAIEKKYPELKSNDSAKQNEAKAKYATMAIKVLKELSEQEQKAYLQKVSKKAGYTEEYLSRQLVNGVETAQIKVHDTMSGENKALYFVLACLLNNLPFATLEQKPDCESLFLQNVFDYVFSCFEKNEKCEFSAIFTPEWGGTKEQIDRLCNVEFLQENFEQDKLYFNDCKKVLLLAPLTVKKNLLIEKLKTATEEQILEIYQQIELLTKQQDEINSKD